jgi:hypothetical protein
VSGRAEGLGGLPGRTPRTFAADRRPCPWRQSTARRQGCYRFLVQHAATTERGWPVRAAGSWRIPAALLCAALTSGGGCSNGEPLSSSGQPSSPTVAPTALVLPTEADARLSDVALSEAFARRYLVPDVVARDYAVGVARDKGHLGSDARPCVSWLRVGQDGSLLATEYVLGSGPECAGWSQLLAAARGAAEPQTELVAAQRATARWFFTVAVSPYSFRHPLHEAHAGVPMWVMRAARAPGGSAPQRCEPRYVRARTDASRSELAGYECAEGMVAFDHLSGAPGTPLTARTDALGAFKSWQRALARQYADAIPARIDRLERLWTRRSEAEQP